MIGARGTSPHGLESFPTTARGVEYCEEPRAELCNPFRVWMFVLQNFPVFHGVVLDLKYS